MVEVGEEFKVQQFDVVIEEIDEVLMLMVIMGNDFEFVYVVYMMVIEQFEFGLIDMLEVDESEKFMYYCVEVYLSEGGQNYDIMGWLKILVINDVIDQFYKY